MLEDIKKDAAERMGKCVVAFRNELKKLRTGRASTSLLEHLRVEYYGSDVPLQQVANVAVEDSRTLTVVPWEKPMVQVIEKAIMKSDLGLTPNTAGMVIRVPLPALRLTITQSGPESAAAIAWSTFLPSKRASPRRWTMPCIRP